MTEITKFFSPIKCPHCDKITYIVFNTYPPQLGNEILTLEKVEEYKTQAREMAHYILDEKEKTAFLETLNDPSYILDKEELEKIISQITQPPIL